MNKDLKQINNFKGREKIQQYSETSPLPRGEGEKSTCVNKLDFWVRGSIESKPLREVPLTRQCNCSLCSQTLSASPLGRGNSRAAFTLAEVLITLGIIGVVAAMTLPTLIQKHQKKTWVEQLKKSVTTIENGFKMALAEDGVDSLLDTELFSPCTGNNYFTYCHGIASTDKENRAKFAQNLSKYLKITKFVDGYDAESDKDFNYEVYTLGNKSEEPFFFSGDTGIMLTDGVLVTFYIASTILTDSECERIKNLGGGYCTSVASYVIIDVNGQKGPNTYGRDVFIFDLAGNGKLYPSGGKDYAIRYGGSNWANSEYYWKSSKAASDGYDCNPQKPSSLGHGCAARIIENGWVMDY